MAYRKDQAVLDCRKVALVRCRFLGFGVEQQGWCSPDGSISSAAGTGTRARRPVGYIEGMVHPIAAGSGSMGALPGPRISACHCPIVDCEGKDDVDSASGTPDGA